MRPTPTPKRHKPTSADCAAMRRTRHPLLDNDSRFHTSKTQEKERTIHVITTTPSRGRPAALLTALAVAVGLVALPATVATAAEGPAPAPHEYRVLHDIHTDAIATFFDDGSLALGT